MGTRNDDISLILAKAKKQGFLPDVSDSEVDILTKEAKTMFGSDSSVGSGTYETTLPFSLGLTTELDFKPTLTEVKNWYVGDIGYTPKALFAKFSQAQANPVNRYYASPTGNDSNTGAYDQPWRTIKKCIDAANAAGQPARILVTAGNYMDGQGFEGTSPTVDTAFVAAGGPVVVSNGLISTDYSAFAVHATYTNTYYINPTPTGGISRVLDTTRVNQFGSYVELKKVTSDVICNNTPDSYYEGTALYIHRSDGAAPTFANTRILKTKANFALTAEKNVYIGTEDGSSWVLEGSENIRSNTDPGVIVIHTNVPSNATEKAVVIEGTRIDFGGEPTAAANAFSMTNWNGIVALFNCQGSAASKDIFNAHNAGNIASKSIFITVNCTGLDAGRIQPSCNGLTIHENVKGIDIAGNYIRGRGGTVHNINTTKQWLLGTHIEGDLGDIESGGNITPTGLMLNDTAEAWVEKITIKMPPGTFASRLVASGTKLHRRNCSPTPQPDAGIGTFDTF